MIPPPDLHVVRFADLDVATLYALLRLRTDVFVVEQLCPYPELDGRDVEPTSLHAWLDDGSGPVAVLRVLAGPGGTRRIGRVCTRADARGRGLSGRLLTDVLAVLGPVETVLDAQSHLRGWYARFGYAADGREFIEDGIPHVPMRRPAPTVVP